MVTSSGIPSLPDLVRYIEEQTGGASALDRITVAHSLAYDLGVMADQLTDHFVQRARHQGQSWAEIGRKLGMSKQGAQQRYAVPAGEGDEALVAQMLALDIPPPGDPWRKEAVRKTLKKVKEALHFQRFTAPARQVVVMAQLEARDNHHPYIAPEHLLLAMLGTADEGAGKALASLGVREETARPVILEHLGPGTATRPGHIPFTKEAKKALELSLREAIRLRHDHVGTEHVLLGLLRGKNGAIYALQKLGVGAGQAVAEVERLLHEA